MTDPDPGRGDLPTTPVAGTPGGSGREVRLAEAFVRLADTLVSDFDALAFLYGLSTDVVDLVDAQAAGILLADGRGDLQLVASSDDRARFLEIAELQHEEGPCLDAYRTGSMVVNAVLTEDNDDRWPQFAPKARAAGFGAAHALPLRLRDQTIGALNLFSEGPHIHEVDVALVQAMADIATIGLLNERIIHESHILTSQLQSALNSRVMVEQAKGVLAERTDLPMDQTFDIIRAYARDHSEKIAHVAREIIDNELDPRDP
jgi:hypothetical protein